MRRLMLLMVIAATLMFASGALACPFCKDALPSSDAMVANGVPGGFNNSIYFMFISLFSMMGWVAFTLVRGALSWSSQQNDAAPAKDDFPTE